MPNLLPTSEAAVITLINTMAVANWNPPTPVTLFDASVVGRFCWDAVNQRWIAGAWNVTDTVFWVTHDGGKLGWAAGLNPPAAPAPPSWNRINNSSAQTFLPQVTSLACSYATANVAVIGVSGKVAILNGFTDTISAVHDYSAGDNWDTAVVDYFTTTSGSGTFNFQVFGYAGSGPSTGYWLQLADSTSPAGGFNNAAGLPAAFLSGSGTPSGGQGQNLFVANNCPNQATPSDGLEVVVFGGAVPGTDTPRLMSITTAAVATDRTGSLPTPGPSYVITGLAYSQTDRVWGILLGTISAGTYMYTSPDLVTWTLVHQFPFASYVQMGGLATLGSVWIVYIGHYGSATVTENNNIIMYSTNVNSSNANSFCTWNIADVRLIANGINLGPFCQFASSGAQILAGNYLWVAISNKVGVTTPATYY